MKKRQAFQNKPAGGELGGGWRGSCTGHSWQARLLAAVQSEQEPSPFTVWDAAEP